MLQNFVLTPPLFQQFFPSSALGPILRASHIAQEPTGSFPPLILSSALPLTNHVPTVPWDVAHARQLCRWNHSFVFQCHSESQQFKCFSTCTACKSSSSCDCSSASRLQYCQPCYRSEWWQPASAWLHSRRLVYQLPVHLRLKFWAHKQWVNSATCMNLILALCSPFVRKRNIILLFVKSEHLWSGAWNVHDEMLVTWSSFPCDLYFARAASLAVNEKYFFADY